MIEDIVIENSRGIWYIDKSLPPTEVWHKVKKIVAEKQTPFQHVLILDTEAFGRMLVIDGIPQSAEFGERRYHEALVHPAMVQNGNARSVAVLGAGEGATLREILKYNAIEHLDAVDIDSEVVEFCRNYLECMHQGSFENPRVELIIDDAKNFLQKTNKRFDVIISDLTDPYEEGASVHLYTPEFFKLIAGRLNNKGIFVMQAQELEETSYERHLKNRKILKDTFKSRFSYATYVKNFYANWSFILAPLDDMNPETLTPSEVEARLQENDVHDLRYYSPKTHASLFTLPPTLERALESS